MRQLLALVLVGLPLAAAAADWQFDAPVELTATGAAAHFHHLDGAGRRHVAAAGQEVAIAWEDDHSGMPQVYLAVMSLGADTPAARYRLSLGEEAYEPAVVAAGPGRWVAAWEQDETVVARVVDGDGPGPVTLLADQGARQVTLAQDGAGGLAAAWAKSTPAGQLLEVASLRVEGREIVLAESPIRVAPLQAHAYQGHPAATWAPGGRLVVAWEDRRAGHTRLYFSSRDQGGTFAPERQLNEHNAPPADGDEALSLGSGVMRVMLATDAGGGLQAIWLDKRNPSSGYAVWGAASTDGGERFGVNAIVQDDLGAAVPQWHAALAGGVGGFVAVWDDTREAWGDEAEPGDVILSTRVDGAWSPDLVVPVASGAGYQGSPAAALGPDGSLHLVWIEKADLSAPSRLFYARALPAAQ
jgi:hypothetical protein